MLFLCLKWASFLRFFLSFQTNTCSQFINILQAAFVPIFLCPYSCAKKLQSQIVIREKLHKTLLFAKGVRKVLMKLTPDEMGRSLNQLVAHMFRVSIRNESMLLQLKKQTRRLALLSHPVYKCISPILFLFLYVKMFQKSLPIIWALFYLQFQHFFTIIIFQQMFGQLKD